MVAQRAVVSREDRHLFLLGSERVSSRPHLLVSATFWKLLRLTPTCSFWSSSPHAVSPNYTWHVSFDDGYVNVDNSNGQTYVRLVRTMQWLCFARWRTSAKWRPQIVDGATRDAADSHTDIPTLLSLPSPEPH